MGFFLIATPYIENSRSATLKEIKDQVIKKGVADGNELLVEREKFKMGNLDTLMFMNDKLIKLENTIESLLKKIDRQYIDITSVGEAQNNSSVQGGAHRWEIKTPDGQISVDKYIYRFKWVDSKFPRSYTLNKLVESFEGKINHLDNELRAKANSYNQTKTSLNQSQQKEGNYNVKDLTEVLVEPLVRPTDFVYTKYITTVIVIVPISQEEEFLANYEFLTDNVVPNSATKLGVPDKDNLGIWKVNLFTMKISINEDRVFSHEEENKKKNKKDLTIPQQFIEALRERFRITAKEFKYESGLAQQRQGKRSDLQVKIKQQQKALIQSCEVCMTDAFEIYLHSKVLRLMIETNMRFGKDNVVIYLIDYVSGKEKLIQTELIEIFGDKDSQGLYGTKDEIDDAEDFFPFVFVPIMSV